MKRNPRNIVLTGFSGTGKSAVAKELARRLGWQAFDTDDEVVRVSGKAIADVFAEYGEKKFREMERKAVHEACHGEKRVIATGGGVVISEENRNALAECGVVVQLEARADTILQRVQQDAASGGSAGIRPLLATEDAAAAVEKLKASRAEYYATADALIHTDGATIDSVCQQVVREWQRVVRALEPGPAQRLAAEVRTAAERYRVHVGWGVLDMLGDRMQQCGLSGKAVLVSDENVYGLYGHRVAAALQGAQFKVVACTVPPGEGSKSFEQATKLYDFFVRSRVERTDTVVALGGGVVGDLAGYVAAGYMRGISFVQVPTSLVAMVDASIGGKVAVNHAEGKNLVGAFHQPKLVLADAQTLVTLPPRELTSGWAEVIKHGLILDPVLFNFLNVNAAGLMKLEPGMLVEAIAHSAAVKARVVTEDEKETGMRIILNYGHTIGHALEAATHYETFLHGEAIAIGMAGAARLAQRVKIGSGKLVKEHEAVLRKFGLPTSTKDIAEADVFAAMELDKKTQEGALRWVLLEDIGKAVVSKDVDVRDVGAALAEIMK